MAGIYGCGVHGSPLLNIKPDIAYRGVVGSSSHVMPTMACAMAGIYGCGIQESAYPNMNTRHCISGCGRVVPSGLCNDVHKTNASLRAEHLGWVWDLKVKRCFPYDGALGTAGNAPKK